jgi:hypothetical protein
LSCELRVKIEVPPVMDGKERARIEKEREERERKKGKNMSDALGEVSFVHDRQQ